MKTVHPENSTEPADHRDNIRVQLTELIDHLRADVERIVEPRFQALLETSAEVLQGVRSAFERYDEHRERAAQAVDERAATRARAKPPTPANNVPPIEVQAEEKAPQPSHAPTPDPDVIAAQASNQKRSAREPQRPRKAAAPKVTPTSGKPLYARGGKK